MVHLIRIRPELFGVGFDVEIVPPFNEGPCHDRELRTIEGARLYADRLAKALELPVLDLTLGEAA